MTEAIIRVPTNFEPRHYQLPVLDALDTGYRRAICVWHRRAGKDKTFLNYQIKSALRRVGVYYYFFPTYAQARKVIWDGVDGAGFRFIDHFPKSLIESRSEAEMKIRLVNGSVWQLIGADKIDSIVGTNPIGCIFSEFSLQNDAVWDHLRPILKENGGWALFNFTPRGKNHAWRLLQMAEKNANWFSQRLTVEDTGVLSAEDVEAERAEGMSERLIRQEYFCSFETEIEGAFWRAEWIDAHRVYETPKLEKVVLAIDPAAGSGVRKEAEAGRLNDETGVAVLGRGEDGCIYVLESDGFRLPPPEWAARSVEMFDRWEADIVVAEANQGGEMVEAVLRNVRPNLPVRLVRATRGKDVRAEPISVLYKNGRIKHVGAFPILEDQLCSFPVSAEHDDRLDAMVYGATELSSKSKPLLLGVIRR